MTREQQDRLFEPFNSSSGGTGLGMALFTSLFETTMEEFWSKATPAGAQEYQ